MNLDTGALAVRRSLEETKAKRLQFKELKAGPGRVIAMPALLLTELRRHRAAQAAHGLQVGSLYQNNDLVTPNPDGTPLRPNTLTHWFEEFIRGVDVPPITFHALRHSAATLMLARGAGVRVVQAALGHSNPYPDPRHLRPRLEGAPAGSGAAR